MGLRGPIPKPSVIEIAEGYPGKRKLDPREPKPTVGEPDMPKHLTAAGRRHWRRLVDMLIQTRVLTVQDGDALGMLAQHMADYDEIQKEFYKGKTGGWLVKDESKRTRISPLVRIRNEINDKIHIGLREFGMTPSARTRVQTVGPERRMSTAEEMCG
jgi:P27 family predicted phage terminase small subunit